MSVRAYRVHKIDHEQADTFNLWHDDKLMEFFDGEYGFYEMLSGNGIGMVELPVEALEEAVKQASELGLDEEKVKDLQRDIKASRENGYVTYYCY